MPSERRLHPASILFALSGSLKTFALPAVLLLFSSLRGGSAEREGEGPSGPGGWFNRWTPGGTDLENWQIWLLLLMALAIVSAVVRYLTFRLTYGDSELVIRSGLLFRNERHVPYDRIQNLDATRSVLHRALGVAEVRIETGGGPEPEARISVLRESEFEEMRRRVFAGRARAGDVLTPTDETAPALPAVAVPEPQASHTLLQLPLRELLLLGVLDNRGFLFIVAAYGVLWESGLQGRLWDQVTATFSAPGLLSSMWGGLVKGQLPSLGLLLIMAGGLLALVAVVRVLSMVWVSVTLHDFRLTRAGNDLRTEYGLLTRVTSTIPRGRIQSLTVRETPLQRWCGRASIRVRTAGGAAGPEQASKRPRELLAPIVRASAVPEFIKQVLPQADMADLEWQSLHPRAARRAIKPLLVLIAVSAAGVYAIVGSRYWPVVLVYLVLGIAAVVHITRRQVRRMAWASGADVIALRGGWLWRSVTLAPVTKIQTVTATESPFDRRTQMAGVSIDTAGGSDAWPAMRIPYLARDTALALAATLATKAAQTAFRW
jgi:putative membrane protein